MVKYFQISLINSQYKLIGLHVLLTLFRYLITTAQSILIGFSHLKYTILFCDLFASRVYWGKCSKREIFSSGLGKRRFKTVSELFCSWKPQQNLTRHMEYLMYEIGLFLYTASMVQAHTTIHTVLEMTVSCSTWLHCSHCTLLFRDRKGGLM